MQLVIKGREQRSSILVQSMLLPGRARQAFRRFSSARTHRSRAADARDLESAAGFSGDAAPAGARSVAGGTRGGGCPMQRSRGAGGGAAGGVGGWGERRA